MKYIKISAFTLCLSAFSVMATAQNVTLHKQGGVGQVYEVEKVDSVVYFPIGDTEQFPAPEVENSTTLWDVIKAQPNLKKFAAILEAATYYTSQPTELHFSQVLAGSIPLNVYAPNDAAISDAEYTHLLDLAQTDGKRLQQQFICNHISPEETSFNSKDVVKMLNGKQIVKSTIGVVSTNEEAAIGKLYVVSSVLPYLPNMKEYLETSPDCSLAQSYMTTYGSTGNVYDASSSITAPTKDGNVQVLDSAFSNRNLLMDQYLLDNGLLRIKGFGVDLADEAGSFSMIMPTDQVWNDAQAKLAPLYKYSSYYEDKIQGDQGTAYLILNMENPDSISTLSMGADIIVPLLGRTTSAPSTQISNGTAFTASEWSVPASEYKPDVEVALNSKNNFYCIQNTSTYYKVGGGTALYDLSLPSSQQITDQYGDVSNENFYCVAPPGPKANPHVEIKLVGENGEQVMSGKYDICVVMAPYWYTLIGIPKGLREATTDRYSYNDAGEVVKVDTIIYYPEIDKWGEVSKEERDSIFLADAIENAERLKDNNFADSISAISKQSFIIQMRYCNNSTNGKDAISQKSSVMAYEGSKVDTITVFEDFEFPYTYKNIPNSYPTLIIEGATKSSSVKQGFMYGLCIDKIILRSKENGNEIEVIP